MMQIPTWSRIVTLLVVLAGILFALPNALPDNVRNRLPPFFPRNTVSLGLDLQGGSYLLLEVELDQVQKDRLETLLGDIRVGLRKAHIPYNDLQSAGDSVSVHIIDAGRVNDAKDILKALNPLVTGGVLSVGAHAYDMSDDGNGTITMKMTDAYKTGSKNDIVTQSIEVVRRRIDQLGTKEPTIERQGDDRIVVQVPGLSDPERLIKILGTTAKMTFQLVDSSANVDEARKGIVPIGDELLYEDNPIKGQPPVPYVLEKRIMVSGDRLTDAQGTFNQQNGGAVVTFRFDSVGARQFGNATKDNVGRLFAIVLDNKVVEAPVIKDAILGGSGEISGNFTIQSANDLAVLLRAGALPAPLKPLERRTVGAELGADAIHAGKIATLGGLLLVALFMFARYGMFGLFADVALTLNIILLLAVLTMLGATLTLPGIAGIVLTMGMAVDANVLIYERIREEHRNGRTIIASIDAGFRRAMATIIDANATHVIASIILFELGSGPVRGFAVTLLIGILTSFFTAVMVTRLIVVTWYANARPKVLTL
ncbi:MAG TPA: protein translocase subunit SecD [Rhizomicrobium sp.]|jgi:SecD/SecF fusion protein